MADTTTPSPRVKEYVDYAKQQVDEQAILDKYNAATIAQFNAQREQNRIAENQFYNQMYNTQRTAMDTIRKANASAVTTGASRGVQAANELSALLGLEQESVASATELAQANRQTAQEETAAVLENVLNAYQQASQERSQLVTQAIEAASLDATEAQARAAEQQADTANDEYLRNLKVSDPDLYNQKLAEQNDASNFEGMTEQDYNTNLSNAILALDDITNKIGYNVNDFNILDLGRSGSSKKEAIRTELQNLYVAYGLDAAQADKALEGVDDAVKATKPAFTWLWNISKEENNMKQAARNYIRAQFQLAYAAKYNEVHTTESTPAVSRTHHSHANRGKGRRSIKAAGSMS